MDRTAEALARLIQEARHLIEGKGSSIHANGTATITSSDLSKSVTAIVPATWVAGPAIAFYDQGTQRWYGVSGVSQGLVSDRLIVNERHVPLIDPARDIGPIWLINGEYIYPDFLVGGKETGRRIVIPRPAHDRRSYLAIIDVDKESKPHAFIPVYNIVNNVPEAALRALVLHSGTVLDLRFPHPILPGSASYLARICNDHFWSFPTYAPSEKGYTFNILDVNEPEDVEFFSISVQSSGPQGGYLGVVLGNSTMSGVTPTYPGGPSFPFSYSFEGTAEGALTHEYSTMPDVVIGGPLAPPVEGDGFAEEPIKTLEFPVPSTIVAPSVLVVDDVSYPIHSPSTGQSVTFFVGWSSRATFVPSSDNEDEGPIIRLEVRGILFEGFEPISARLTGQTGAITYVASTCNAQYTLPMLTDKAKGLMILEQFDGSVYTHAGNENPWPTTEEEANERYVTESGINRIFMLSPDGERPVDGSWHQSIYITPQAIALGSDVVVGQVVTMQFASLAQMDDAYVNYHHHIENGPNIPGAIMGIPGISSGRREWINPVDYSDPNPSEWARYRSRLSRNIPRPEHAAALAAKLSAGSKIYGYLEKNSKNRRTFFKGVITSSSYSLIPVGSPMDPAPIGKVRSFGSMETVAYYHLSNLSFEVTEIVADTSLLRNVGSFNIDSMVPFKIWQPTGMIAFDGSLRNIYPDGAYSSSWIAHSSSLTPRFDYTDNNSLGTRLYWEDPYIWKSRRSSPYSAMNGWTDKKKSQPTEVMRWKLDYSGEEVRCWFDGISLMDLKDPIRGERYDFSYTDDFSFDRKMVIEQGLRSLTPEDDYG